MDRALIAKNHLHGLAIYSQPCMAHNPEVQSMCKSPMAAGNRLAGQRRRAAPVDLTFRLRSSILSRFFTTCTQQQQCHIDHQSSCTWIYYLAKLRLPACRCKTTTTVHHISNMYHVVSGVHVLCLSQRQQWTKQQLRRLNPTLACSCARVRGTSSGTGSSLTAAASSAAPPKPAYPIPPKPSDPA